MLHRAIHRLIKEEDASIIVLAGPLLLCVLIVILGFINVAYAQRQQNRISSMAEDAAVAACSHLPTAYHPGGNTPAEMVAFTVSAHADQIYGDPTGTLVYQDANSVTVTVTAPEIWIYSSVLGDAQGTNTATYSATRIQNRITAAGRSIYEYRTQPGTIS